MNARPMKPDEHAAGHAVCDCGEFTHVFRQCAMQRLPKDYSGELCQRCAMWMCRVDKLATVTPQAGEGFDVLTVSAGSPRPPAWVTDGEP